MKKGIKLFKEQRYKGTFIKRLDGKASKDSVKGLKSVDANGKPVYRLTIKFADYTRVDNSGDLMLKGCFDQSIAEAATSNRKIAFLWQHDRKDPIGRIISFDEKEDGMYCTVELSDFESVENAKRTWAQVNDGTLNQASFGYCYDWSTVRYVDPVDPNESEGARDQMDGETEEGYFAIGRVDLFEVSIVTLGDNENTEVVDTTTSEKSLITNFLNRDNVKAALLALGAEDIKEFLKEYGIETEPKRTSLFGK